MILENGREYKLLYNMYALELIEAELGDISNLETVFSGKDKIKNLNTFIQIGINARIELNNYINGEKEKPYDRKQIAMLLSTSALAQLQVEVQNAFAESFQADFETDGQKNASAPKA
jgi:hypothetical protein